MEPMHFAPQPMLDQLVITFHPYAKRLAAPLKRLGIVTVRDLLLFTPVRHEDLRVITLARDLRQGQRAVLRGRVMTIANRRSPRRRMLITEALIADATGTMRCVWFQQPYLAYAFRIGTPVVVAGAVESDAYGLRIASPIIERDQAETLHTGRLVPVYPLTYGISQKQLRLLIHAALPFAPRIPDMFPETVRASERLLTMSEAACQMHFPSDPATLARARERFAFEEAFAYFLRVRASREELDRAIAPAIPTDDAVARDFIRQLPFPLTGAQQRAVREILSDMAGEHHGDGADGLRLTAYGSVRPMQRLLNGDVGSGKTAVAAIAAASVARAGLQVAYLAPTEVLAVQQARTFTEWLVPLGVHVALWTRTSRTMDGALVTPSVMRSAVRGGTAGVIIGTHAILSESVRFRALGLAIIDEQHRFGVEQRAALRAKAGGDGLPHLLSMTATPIPRTLSLSMLGDLDVSVLDELPTGRTPVATTVVGPAGRLMMTREIRDAIARGHQAFIVCPKIDVGSPPSGEASGDDAAAVAEACERAQRAFPGVTIGVLHGRMRKDEQAAAMGEFSARRLSMLVATTVIEVGVDQPNATVMVVEDAERFGLAQLHQLRGRVGRGAGASRCYLTTRSEDAAVLARLRRVAECADGFRIAEMDLEERGPGAVIGTVQSGWPAFRHATVGTEIFRRAQRAAAMHAAQPSARVCVPTAHLE